MVSMARTGGRALMPRNLSKAWSLPGSNPILPSDSLDVGCGGLETLEWRVFKVCFLVFKGTKDSLLAVSM